MSRDELRKAYPDRLVRSEGDGLDEVIAEFGGTVNNEPSMTRQADKDSADINKIVKRFEREGIMPMERREGAYLDVSMVGDYREALEQVRLANEYFVTLPAASRAMFENDPAKLLDAVNDPDQLQLLVDAGVVPRDEVRIAEPPAPAGSGSPPEAGVKGPESP